MQTDQSRQSIPGHIKIVFFLAVLSEPMVGQFLSRFLATQLRHRIGHDPSHDLENI